MHRSATPERMKPRSQTSMVPVVQLLGDMYHRDFRDARSLLADTAELNSGSGKLPQLTVIAQSRPGVVDPKVIARLRRNAPLTAVVSLLGSWCEGETRTGRPLACSERIFWYDFPAWWTRQLALLSNGRCPDWHRADASRFRVNVPSSQQSEPGRPRPRGAVILQTQSYETGRAISDLLYRAGYASVSQSTNKSQMSVRGIAAGIWEGGQLSDEETSRLCLFTRQLAVQNAPVLACSDFPRRDRVDLAMALGASAIVGKPWINRDLIETLERIVQGEVAKRRRKEYASVPETAG